MKFIKIQNMILNASNIKHIEQKGKTLIIESSSPHSNFHFRTTEDAIVEFNRIWKELYIEGAK